MGDSPQPRLLHLNDEQLTSLQHMLGFQGQAAVLVWPPAPEPAGLGKLVDLLQGMAGDLKAVADGNYQLKAEKEQLMAERDELEGQQAEKFFEFAEEVGREDFWDFAMIMALGNRRKAAKQLRVAPRSFYDRVERWSLRKERGYQKMVRLMAWRKGVGRRIKERLPTGDTDETENPEVVERILDMMKNGDSLNYPALLKLIFVALRSQNRENWAKVRSGLIEMIKGDVEK